MTEVNNLNDKPNFGSEIRMTRNYLEDVRTLRAVKAAGNDIQDGISSRGSIVSGNSNDSHYTPRPIRDFSAQQDQRNVNKKTNSSDTIEPRELIPS